MSVGPWDAERLALLLLWASTALAVGMMAAVVFERTMFALLQRRQRRLGRKYEPLLTRALAGDDAAIRALAGRPLHHRLTIGWLLIGPLLDAREPERVARIRAVATAIGLIAFGDRYLRSLWWWRRALALRALGLMQVRDRTAAIVAALDDRNQDVRAAALDALADLRDPASLPAIVVRMHDPSLHIARRAGALAAFGSECEPFLLELAAVDAQHRLNYARALGICGTARSRPTLCRWTADDRPAVRAATFRALATVGLDDEAARLAIESLGSADEIVRAMAASALRGWAGPGDAAAHLAKRLDDAWPVAVRAARSLKSMGPAGHAELQAQAPRQDLAGALARQMLWETSARC